MVARFAASAVTDQYPGDEWHGGAAHPARDEERMSRPGEKLCASRYRDALSCLSSSGEIILYSKGAIRMHEKLASTLVGVAGEYLVAGELTLRGYLASITLRNSRGIDIIASNADGPKSVNIQVKTNSEGKKSWILNKKAEQYYSDNHYYVFVALQGLAQRPNFHVVPSRIVAEYTQTTHAAWLKGKKHDGSARRDSAIRKFDDHDNHYLEAWELIQL